MTLPSMLFDSFAKAIDRSKDQPWRAIAHDLRTCCIIDMRRAPNEGMPQGGLTRESMGEVMQSFFLPFPDRAHWVEDKTSGTLIRAGRRVNKDEARGFATEGIEEAVFDETYDRMAAACGWKDDRGLAGASFDVLIVKPHERMLVTAMGTIIYVGMVPAGSKDAKNGIYQTAFTPIESCLVDARSGRTINSVTVGTDPEEYSEEKQGWITDVSLAFTQVHCFNSPANIVVRCERNDLADYTTKSLRILPRSQQRERYIVLPRRQVARLIASGLSEDQRRKLKGGHPRRRHLRTLRATRFTHKQGQSVIVRECWVGPRTIIQEGVKYTALPELMGRSV